MSNYNLNRNLVLKNLMIENAKKAEKKYFLEHPNSLILKFMSELRELGYEFEISEQVKELLPKHKETILPIAIRCYQQAKIKNEKSYFMSLFHFKGFEEVIPTLLEDFYSENPIIDRWAIGDRLYQIRSKKYVDDYLNIISNSKYGINRQMIILLVGKLKTKEAIPILLKLLDDNQVTIHAICALADYQMKEFKPYFERFEKDTRSVVRKYAKTALKKLDK